MGNVIAAQQFISRLESYSTQRRTSTRGFPAGECPLRSRRSNYCRHVRPGWAKCRSGGGSAELSQGVCAFLVPCPAELAFMRNLRSALDTGFDAPKNTGFDAPLL